MLISASALIESIAHRVAALAKAELAVFWFQVTSDRESFRQELIREGASLTLVPLVIRGDGFNNPNSMLSDLARIMEANRGAFEGLTGDGATVIVLLGTVPLQVAQLASPVVLPYWFPRLGGKTVHVVIEDLTYTADAPINQNDIQVNRICEELWRLERLLVDRISSVHCADHRRTNALLSYLRNADAGATIASMIDSSRGYRRRFQEPSGFRPSAREKDCFVARLVLLMASAAPDELATRCSALADALSCTQVTKVPTDSMAALALRPTRKDLNIGVQLARNLVATIYASVQLVNAAAHSGEYGRYPVLLLKSYSHDLRTALAALGDVVELLNADTVGAQQA
jgi:hypothetical protein